MAFNSRHFKILLSNRLFISVIALVIIGAGSLVLAYTHKTDQSVCLTGNEKVCGYAGTTNNTPLPEQDNTSALVSNPTNNDVSTPTAPTPSVVQPPKTDNSTQCNDILATGKDALLSLNSQINQQLAIMKQIAGDLGTGLPARINGGGINGLVGNAMIQGSFNQANNTATTLTNQIDPTRQNYLKQLEDLQCWTQALSMLNFNPAAQ